METKRFKADNKLRTLEDKLNKLDRELKAQLKTETYKHAIDLLEYLHKFTFLPKPDEPWGEDDKLLKGIKEIARYLDLKHDQAKHLSPVLQLGRYAFKKTITTGKHNYRSQQVCAYSSRLRAYMHDRTHSRKETLRYMRRARKFHKCPNCGEKVCIK